MYDSIEFNSCLPEVCENSLSIIKTNVYKIQEIYLLNNLLCNLSTVYCKFLQIQEFIRSEVLFPTL